MNEVVNILSLSGCLEYTCIYARPAEKYGSSEPWWLKISMLSHGWMWMGKKFVFPPQLSDQFERYGNRSVWPCFCPSIPKSLTLAGAHFYLDCKRTNVLDNTISIGHLSWKPNNNRTFLSCSLEQHVLNGKFSAMTENGATSAKGKHSAIVFARCVCEEYRSTGNCLFMRDSLIEMVSQRANSMCVSRRFIMLCHADLRPNKLYVFEPIDRRSSFCCS